MAEIILLPGSAPPPERLEEAIERTLFDGRWRLCSEIALASGEQPWDVKGHLRSRRVNGREVLVRRRADGLWEYQLRGLAR